MTALQVFVQCVEAIQRNVLIRRENRSDKEFHFQNWFRDRLQATGLNFDPNGRNSYPDFTMVASTEGYEVKGLAYPGREADFDSNSQIPTGVHNGRTIHYAFGRYPAEPDGDQYPVMDFVLCHGDLLNADHEYSHENKSVRGFGSYGDILIRDRKMYVVPTPFRLLNGVGHEQTLILPAETPTDDRFMLVGEFSRKETSNLLVGYSFDLLSNELAPRHTPNPEALKEHLFRAWRLKGASNTAVTLRQSGALL